VGGVFEASILALWTMFSNSGKLPLSLVIRSLLKEGSYSLRRYRDVLLNCNIRFAIQKIGDLLNHRVGEAGVTGLTSPSYSKMWNQEEP